ncbi:MAG: endonuclease III [Bacteroidales bacterium]|nr:endonuclease III [Bacteroidales bacterium]
METKWSQYLAPIIEQYGKRKHPLDYQNRYQLVAMVILSAQDSDKHINELGGNFFNAFPSIKELAKATPEDLVPYVSSVRNFGNKSNWLIKLAQILGDDKNIPTTMEELVKLPGIGRKSANVIIRESGGEAEGVIVDLHVLRVAPRLGIVKDEQKPKPEKVEKQIMAAIPQELWNQTGMAISFLGREICRPTYPKCNICKMNTVCKFYKENR